MNNRTLYRIPEEGVIKGVCAGLADYLGVPAALVRVIALLAVLCGLFVLPVALYAALAIFLPVAHETGRSGEDGVTSARRLSETAQTLDECEQRLRRVERYVTSDAFGVRSRFRDL
ncbi:envelope stress response membrane protein PspC [Enterobacillus tribolii]|uniref:Phage shock protein C (PspC) family protein n=1 Tax=Enterobacillus tribolii TaxID=1487935 RepID=A0A370R3E8_9GAMM|nr:envelope stress response membrane protein PspC [Enterobacillus tribolii]MBW7984023.1 envelope stress response membrane protein PspC [Enterobacillus tribolii]RDK96964.1 phage shock protein C (PspC) family protein [Enterobacillus tribolii]